MISHIKQHISRLGFDGEKEVFGELGGRYNVDFERYLESVEDVVGLFWKNPLVKKMIRRTYFGVLKPGTSLGIHITQANIHFIYINARFVNEADDKRLKEVILHELMHVYQACYNERYSLQEHLGKEEVLSMLLDWPNNLIRYMAINAREEFPVLGQLAFAHRELLTELESKVGQIVEREFNTYLEFERLKTQPLNKAYA